MKAIFVTRGWPTKKDPMMGNYESVQAKALAKRGVDITVISLHKKSLMHIFESRAIRKRDEDGVMILTVPVVVTEIPQIAISKNSRLDLWLSQRAFLRAYEYYRKKKGEADVIHAHFVIHAYNCRMVLNRYQIPFVITEHWSKMNYATLEKNILKRCEAYNWADRVVCVSKALADSLKQKFGLECKVVHNMVSDQFFDQEPVRQTSKNEGVLKFVSVGSLVQRKGYDLIVNALQKCKHLDKCELNIIGGGPEEANLKALIDKCQLQDKVFLLGVKTPQEVGRLIADSDCLILTSRRETFGIVYIEAMAKGKPVIATTCGGPESFVNESNGLLIPAEDVEAITKAIDYMVEHLDQYDGESIRHFCYENFSEDAISKQIISLYEEVINNKRKNGKNK